MTRKERSHEAILDSASALLRERGITASSVQDVMRGAGLTVGGFYSHFESKESLFSETIRWAAREKWDALMAGAPGKHPVPEFARRYLSRTHRDARADGCLLPSAVADVSRDDGVAYRAPLAGEVGRFARRLDELGARDVGLGVVALLYGALSLSRALAGTPLSDDVLRSAKKLVEKSLG